MKLCKFEARAKIPILLHKALISHTQSKFIISIRASLGEDGGWLDGYRYYWVGITGTKLLQLLSKGKDLYDVMLVHDLQYLRRIGFFDSNRRSNTSASGMNNRLVYSRVIRRGLDLASTERQNHSQK